MRQSWRARLAAAGATFWKEDHGNQRSLYVVDPSGNVLEITTPETPPFAAGPEQPDATPDGIVRSLDRAADEPPIVAHATKYLDATTGVPPAHELQGETGAEPCTAGLDGD